jgi:hypothetical protein
VSGGWGSVQCQGKRIGVSAMGRDGVRHSSIVLVIVLDPAPLFVVLVLDCFPQNQIDHNDEDEDDHSRRNPLLTINDQDQKSRTSTRTITSTICGGEASRLALTTGTGNRSPYPTLSGRVARSSGVSTSMAPSDQSITSTWLPSFGTRFRAP